MRRTILSLVLGVIATCLFVAGLAWMISLPVRGWSDDPEIRKGQALFVITVVAVVLGGYILDRSLNGSLGSTTPRTLNNDPSAAADVRDHPLRDRFANFRKHAVQRSAFALRENAGAWPQAEIPLRPLHVARDERGDREAAGLSPADRLGRGPRPAPAP